MSAAVILLRRQTVVESRRGGAREGGEAECPPGAEGIQSGLFYHHSPRLCPK